jgi:hypothetical protein
MGKLTDPEILACYRNALANWRYDGYIVLTPPAEECLRRHLPGYAPRAFGELLFRFVIQENGDIDQVVEAREEWRDQWSHHYDDRPIVGGFKLYVETRLRYNNVSDPDDPFIVVVNLHPA